MRVAPEADEAGREREDAGRILAAVLHRVTAQLRDEGAPALDIPPQALSYPGLFAAAYAAQAAARATRPARETRDALASGLADAVRRADASAARRDASGCSAWRVDLSPPEEHLVASLARAVSQVPQRPDRIEALAALRIGAWDDEDRAAFAAATGLLAHAWPEMLAELRVVVVQIALLRGFGVDGFTDVATHGAIYVNGARLRRRGESGLDGPVRLAEAVVHEGTHNRCNAAALSTPFLADAGSGDEPVLQTPLRQDPRPLTGLLQQLVVLVRSRMLYDRLLDAGKAEQTLVDRREKLRSQAAEALRVISGHTGRLTDHGRSVVAEARDLHARRVHQRRAGREAPSPAQWGRVQLFRPFEACPEIVFGRTAARSDAFGATDAGGGAAVLIGSAAGLDEVDVAIRARHELIERVSNVLAGRAADRAGMVVASFGQLRARRIDALDPAAWTGAPDGVREIPMSWVAGRSLLDDREVLVPAGAAFLRHVPRPGGARALTTGSAGVAAHVDRAQAVRHALREVLERDLVARSWVGDGRAWVATPAPALPESLDAALTKLGLEVTALVVPGPEGWGSLVACLHTPERGAQSFGARCIAADDSAAGFARAVFEALMVRWSMGTAVAGRAREAMRGREPPARPAGALEHALWTYDEQDSLGLWLERCVPPEQREPGAGDLPSAVAKHTGGDVVAVDSTVPTPGSDTVVMRVVVPGARSLPSQATRGTRPHPFG